MAVSRGLRRLLRIRTLEEQQSRMELESAMSELRLLEQALDNAAGRETHGRRMIETSARTGVIADRLAGLVECDSAGRQTTLLQPRIASAEEDAAELRRLFLAARVERRQAETLVEEAETREELDAARRGQKELDDAFGSRRSRNRK